MPILPIVLGHIEPWFPMGDRTMAKWGRAQRVGMAVALLVLTALLGTARAADDDDALRKKALELNRITGDDAQSGKIIALLKDVEETKKLLAVASRMVKDKEKEKDEPFNINATFILARAAHGLKQVEISEQFYKLNVQQALKLLSGEKIGRAYTGLMDLYLANKKYADCEKLCREFLGIEGDEGIDRIKPGVLRRLILVLAKEDEVDKALEIVDKLIKASPENWLNLEL